MKPICCGIESRWVENISGKGYNFCGECRKEVLTPLAVEKKSQGMTAGTALRLMQEQLNQLYSSIDMISTKDLKQRYPDKTLEEEYEGCIKRQMDSARDAMMDFIAYSPTGYWKGGVLENAKPYEGMQYFHIDGVAVTKQEYYARVKEKNYD